MVACDRASKPPSGTASADIYHSNTNSGLARPDAWVSASLESGCRSCERCLHCDAELNFEFGPCSVQKAV